MSPNLNAFCAGGHGCYPKARRIRLNLEFAKKLEKCLEYIVLYVLAHLLERRHSERFTALMDKHLPDWRARRDLLNSDVLRCIKSFPFVPSIPEVVAMQRSGYEYFIRTIHSSGISL